MLRSKNFTNRIPPLGMPSVQRANSDRKGPLRRVGVGRFWTSSPKSFLNSISPAHWIFQRKFEQFVVHEEFEVEDVFVSGLGVGIGFSADRGFKHKRGRAAGVMKGAGEIERRRREFFAVFFRFRTVLKI